MKSAYLFLLFLFMTAHSSFANLGDSPEEAVKRYGQGEKQSAKAPATQAMLFKSSDYKILAEFFDGRCHRISFRKPKTKPFLESEIRRLLDENSSGQTWAPEKKGLNPIADNLGVRRWLRNDRGFAIAGTNDDGTHNLVLTDGIWMKHKLKPGQGNKTAPTQADTTKPHRLDWRGYDGRGDPAAARLLLDNNDLGQGEAGYEELKKRLAALPNKSALKLVRYYGDPASKKKYPFDINALKSFAEAHGIILLVPSAE